MKRHVILTFEPLDHWTDDMIREIVLRRNPGAMVRVVPKDKGLKAAIDHADDNRRLRAKKDRFIREGY